MKHPAFILFVTIFAASSPLTAQSAGMSGLEFVEAVKKSDGNKAMQILAERPKGVVDSKDGEGNTALIVSIARDDEKWTGFLLNQGADPNLPGKGGDTPLIAAARAGFGQAAEWLLAIGAKVDSTNRMGETPLIIAVQQRDAPMVRRLLDAGANPDRPDSAAGYSARDYALRDTRSRDILRLIETKKPRPVK